MNEKVQEMIIVLREAFRSGKIADSSPIDYLKANYSDQDIREFNRAFDELADTVVAELSCGC